MRTSDPVLINDAFDIIYPFLRYTNTSVANMEVLKILEVFSGVGIEPT